MRSRIEKDQTLKNMEDQTQQNKSISEKILSAAQKGELKMRPKWHFILKAGLWIAGIAALFLAILYFLSLFLFIARKTGIWAAPVFGWHGLFVFLISVPWMLVLAVLVFIGILEILVRHYAFAYRLPLLYSALGLLLVVVAGGLIVDRTPLHERIANCPLAGGPPREGNIPPGACGTGFYRDLGPKRFNNIHNGIIMEFQEKNFIMANRQQENLLVIITRKTRLPFGEDFSVGDMVVVIGDRHGDQIEAFGVSRFDE